MSCSLRDAAALEARNVATVVLANDVFAPIAYGTAELLGLERSYVERNVVFFPHPTSNLTRAQIFGLVDAQIETIAAALVGARHAAVARPAEGTDVGAIRSALEPLRRSLLEDGAELTIGELRDGILETRLQVDPVACTDGACVMPRANIIAIIESTLRERFPKIVSVTMEDTREGVTSR